MTRHNLCHVIPHTIHGEYRTCTLGSSQENNTIPERDKGCQVDTRQGRNTQLGGTQTKQLIGNKRVQQCGWQLTRTLTCNLRICILHERQCGFLEFKKKSPHIIVNDRIRVHCNDSHSQGGHLDQDVPWRHPMPPCRTDVALL